MSPAADTLAPQLRVTREEFGDRYAHYYVAQVIGDCLYRGRELKLNPDGIRELIRKRFSVAELAGFKVGELISGAQYIDVPYAQHSGTGIFTFRYFLPGEYTPVNTSFPTLSQFINERGLPVLIELRDVPSPAEPPEGAMSEPPSILDAAKAYIKKADTVMGLDPVFEKVMSDGERVTTVSFDVTLESGEKVKIWAFRALQNDARGTGKGGLRWLVGTGETLEEAKRTAIGLATLMTVKNAVIGIPYGGGKGDLFVPPRAYTENDKARILRGFARELTRKGAIGTFIDVPAPDKGTDDRMMVWFLDEHLRVLAELGKVYDKILVAVLRDVVPVDDPQKTPHLDAYLHALSLDKNGSLRGIELGAITGKTVGKGGSEGRQKATGYGGFIAFKTITDHLKRVKDAGTDVIGKHLNERVLATAHKDVKDLTVAIQGTGNVGEFNAWEFYNAGARITMLQDFNPADKKIYTLYNPRGIDLRALDRYLRRTPDKRWLPLATLPREFFDVTGCELIAGDDTFFWIERTDVKVAGATENVVTTANANRINCDILLELGNSTTTPVADTMLRRRGILVIPDVFANVGGVTVSYFEWLQNIEGRYWGAASVDKMLEGRIAREFESLLAAANMFDTDLRTAAIIVSRARVVNAEIARAESLRQRFSAKKPYIGYGELGLVPDTVEGLQYAARTGDLKRIVPIEEARHERQISGILGAIDTRFDRSRPGVVLVSGPRTSGKIALSDRLTAGLDASGHVTVHIDVDAVLAGFEKKQKADGLADNELYHAMRAKAAELVRDMALSAEPGMTIVFEGDYVLDDVVKEALKDIQHYGVFVNTAPSMKVSGNWPLTSLDLRFMRHLLTFTRLFHQLGLEIVREWPMTRDSNLKHVYPAWKNADATFESSLAYELPVLKRHIEPLLKTLLDEARTANDTNSVKSIEHLLFILSDVPDANIDELIPQNSIIRQFIGGGPKRPQTPTGRLYTENGFKVDAIEPVKPSARIPGIPPGFTRIAPGQTGIIMLGTCVACFVFDASGVLRGVWENTTSAFDRGDLAGPNELLDPKAGCRYLIMRGPTIDAGSQERYIKEALNHLTLDLKIAEDHILVYTDDRYAPSTTTDWYRSVRAIVEPGGSIAVQFHEHRDSHSEAPSRVIATRRITCLPPAAERSQNVPDRSLVVNRGGRRLFNAKLFEEMTGAILVGSARYLRSDDGLIPIELLGDLDIAVIREDPAHSDVLMQDLARRAGIGNIRDERSTIGCWVVNIPGWGDVKAQVSRYSSIGHIVERARFELDRMLDNIDYSGELEGRMLVKQYLQLEYYYGDPAVYDRHLKRLLESPIDEKSYMDLYWSFRSESLSDLKRNANPLTASDRDARIRERLAGTGSGLPGASPHGGMASPQGWAEKARTLPVDELARQYREALADNAADPIAWIGAALAEDRSRLAKFEQTVKMDRFRAWARNSRDAYKGLLDGLHAVAQWELADERVAAYDAWLERLQKVNFVMSNLYQLGLSEDERNAFPHTMRSDLETIFALQGPFRDNVRSDSGFVKRSTYSQLERAFYNIVAFLNEVSAFKRIVLTQKMSRVSGRFWPDMEASKTDEIVAAQPVAPQRAPAAAEVAWAEKLADKIKVIGETAKVIDRASQTKEPIVIGIDSDGWIPPLQRSTNVTAELVKALRDELGRQLRAVGLGNVKIVVASGSELAKGVGSAMTETSAKAQNVAILACIGTINGNAVAFNELGDVTLVGINPKDIQEESASELNYVRIIEMTLATLQLAFDAEFQTDKLEKICAAHPEIPAQIVEVGGRQIIVFAPKADRRDLAELKKLYDHQAEALIRA